jgi:integrase
VDILHNAEKLGRPNQLGGWQKKMARRRYQGGTLRKRGKRNPCWELQWREDYIRTDGTIDRRLVSAKLGLVSELSKRQARKLADEKLRSLNQGQWTPSSTITIREFVDQYFVPNFFPTLKTSTQKHYCCTLKTHILPAFGKVRLCDIGTLEIQRFVLAKMASGLGWESADHFRNLISKIFETAKKWGYHSGPNPAAGVELPEKTPVREKHILEVEQIPRLLTVLEEPVSTMVRLALLTGLRVGEILALDWASIDFASARIHVRRGYYRGSMSSPKTKCSRRSVPLPEVLRPVLLRLREKATSAEELIFPSRKGTPYNDSNLTHRHLKPAGRRLGMPWLNWHTLRRTHATLFQVAGGSLRDAQAQLGHSKMSTTLELYTLPIPEQQRAAVEKLSALMANDGRNGENPEALPLASQQIQ